MDVLTAFGFEGQEKRPAFIALCGGGGKTTTMFRLAREFRMRGRKVLTTTTTKIFNPDSVLYDDWENENSLVQSWAFLKPGTITVAGNGPDEENKLTGLSPERLDRIYQAGIYDVILVEADGSRGKPIKAPADYEPVIPGETATVIGIVGMDCFRKPIDESWVHRPVLFSSLTGRGLGTAIDEAAMIQLVLSPQGLFKNAPSKARKILLLNKAEEEAQWAAACKVGQNILKQTDAVQRVIIGSMKHPDGLRFLERGS